MIEHSMNGSGNELLPVVISTWPFGMAANEVAYELLAKGGSSLDAVEAGITQCEDDASVDSVGWGGLPDANGEVTLDASIMDHQGRCGAVACLHRVRHAIKVARMVMELTPHIMLAGEAATGFALDHGLPQTNLLSPQAGKAFDDWRQAHDGEPGHDTIGMLAIDQAGLMAGGCSTSGTKYKLPGRVGDSPIIGSGLYVLPGIGGAAATGRGEEVMKVCGSFSVVENMRRGMEPREAIAEVLREILRRRCGSADVDVSFIALRADGAYAGLTLRPRTQFQYAVISRAGKRLTNASSVSPT